MRTKLTFYSGLSVQRYTVLEGLGSYSASWNKLFNRSIVTTLFEILGVVGEVHQFGVGEVSPAPPLKFIPPQLERFMLALHYAARLSKCLVRQKLGRGLLSSWTGTDLQILWVSRPVDNYDWVCACPCMCIILIQIIYAHYPCTCDNFTTAVWSLLQW
jgi:hypothetical protein